MGLGREGGLCAQDGLCLGFEAGSTGALYTHPQVSMDSMGSPWGVYMESMGSL
jgi:hypothetical protein